jgi:adenylate cyclase
VGARAPHLSIVVLPFANLSGDASQDYLGDVLTEELTASLARLPDSFVVSRTTAFLYRGKAEDVKAIGKGLGVRYVLEGSAQKSGARIRVNAQLIDAETGAHLWADQFDSDQGELLEMQDEIVTRLARALQIQLAAVEASHVKRTHPENPDAEELAMQCEATICAGEYCQASRRPTTRFASGRSRWIVVVCERSQFWRCDRKRGSQIS